MPPQQLSSARRAVQLATMALDATDSELKSTRQEVCARARVRVYVCVCVWRARMRTGRADIIVARQLARCRSDVATKARLIAELSARHKEAEVRAHAQWHSSPRDMHTHTPVIRATNAVVAAGGPGAAR